MRPLGGKAVAIETLKRDTDLMGSIEKENIRRRHELKPESRQKFYTLLAYHTLSLDDGDKYGFEVGPYAPTYRVTEGMAEYYTPEYKVLEEIKNQEYQSILGDLGDEARVQDVFQRLYKTKDDFSQEVVIDNRRMRILKDNN